MVWVNGEWLVSLVCVVCGSMVGGQGGGQAARTKTDEAQPIHVDHARVHLIFSHLSSFHNNESKNLVHKNSTSTGQH